MKRFVCIWLSAMMLLGGVVACNKKTDAEDENTTVADVQEQTTQSQEESESTTAQAKQEKPTTYALHQVTDKLKISGRYSVLSDGITWDWSASGIEFVADCEGDMEFRYTSTGPVWFKVYVDGKGGDTVFKGKNGNNVTVIAKDLEKGVHTLKIVRMTDIKSSMSIMQSLSFVGTLQDAPKENGFFVEFLGDSLTCGTGTVDGWQGQTEGLGGYQYMDATRAFSYQLANDYIANCDYSMVAIAGSHLAASTKYENFLDVFSYTNYRRNTTEKWEYTRKADLVVINLGTNDAMQRLDTEEFTQKLGVLVDTVRQIHGENVKILFVTNMMTNNYVTQILQVIEAKGGESKGLYRVNLVPDSSGAANHPSGEAHDDAAETIAAFLKKKQLCEIQ